jgi:hypothetical protein
MRTYPRWLASRLSSAMLYFDSARGGYSSVAERRSVAPDVVGSTPTSRPNGYLLALPSALWNASSLLGYLVTSVW